MKATICVSMHREPVSEQNTDDSIEAVQLLRESLNGLL